MGIIEGYRGRSGGGGGDETTRRYAIFNGVGFLWPVEGRNTRLRTRATHTRAHTHTNTRAYTHIHNHARARAHTHTHIRTHTHASCPPRVITFSRRRGIILPRTARAQPIQCCQRFRRPATRGRAAAPRRHTRTTTTCCRSPAASTTVDGRRATGISTKLPTWRRPTVVFPEVRWGAGTVAVPTGRKKLYRDLCTYDTFCFAVAVIARRPENSSSCSTVDRYRSVL